MQKEPPEKLYELIKELCDKNGWTAVGIGVTMPYICDRCQNEDKEAFPYLVMDRDGKFWHDLCNDCFDELGCSYEWSEE